jgi:hypothetical protein
MNSDPTWSPDGTKLAFVSDRDGRQKLEIWVINLDGTGLVRLTTNTLHGSGASGEIYGLDLYPAWSPDGTLIAFASGRDIPGTPALFVMNSDGSNQKKITNDEDRYPTWSPDSQRIAFYRSNAGINIVNRDGTNVVNVAQDGFIPAWSPDGTRFAFQRLDPGIDFNPAIFVMNADGSNPVKITNNTVSSFAQSWAPASSPPIPTSTISGHVLEASGTPISGATLNLTGTVGRSTQSNAAGVYAFTGLGAGSYRIDIAKTGFGFVPASRDFANLTTNQTANFSGFVAFSISGQVNGLGGNGIFVTLSGSQTRSVMTDFHGRYSFDLLPAGGDYTVSITTPIWNISPNNVIFNNLSNSQTANFDAVRATYTISGRLTRLGNPLPAITVGLSDTTGNPPLTIKSDANGQYSFTGVSAGGQYSVRPVGANYLFDPQTRDFNPLDGNKTADFVALSANHLILSGGNFTIGEGGCNLQVTVFRGGNAEGVGPITVDYATSDGTAKAGLDYVTTSGTLSFPEGSFSRTITIPILDDQFMEGAEQFSISLTKPSGEVDLGTPSNATITIADNDPATTPKVVTETNSDRAIAIHSTNWLQGPFHLITPLNLSSDTRTRISIFVENLQFNPCQGLSVITVDAEDAQQGHFSLPLEAVVKVPGNNPFRQLIVRLPENLDSGELLLTISVGGTASNRVRISVRR